MQTRVREKDTLTLAAKEGEEANVCAHVKDVAVPLPH